MAVSQARAAAFDILKRVECEASYASELLHGHAYEQLSLPDHALTTEIVMGVLRWRAKLDSEIAKDSSQPLSKLDIEVLLALRIALYQFRWLDRVPARAALYESVELVKRARKRSATSFVNGVLRKILKRREEKEDGSDDVSSPEALAFAFSHPPWLVDRWSKAYGLPAAQQICAYNQKIPVTSIRLRDPDSEAQLTADGIKVQPGSLLSSARRVDSGDLAKSGPLRSRAVLIQDEGSQLVAALVGHGDRILDCCAAPGGKTLAIADRSPHASVVGLEVHEHRARLMAQLITRASLDLPSRLSVVAADARHMPLNSVFDRVLADVPCSGTGTIARNPEIKWKLDVEDLRKLHELQVEILTSALKQVAPGGRLIYSTCSLEQEENEDVVGEVLSGNDLFRVVDCRSELDRLAAEGKLIWPEVDSLVRGPYLRTIPGVQDCDGFFAAILKRG
jgi:16S rRNA (cytosine967-C5)-methyltransferase